MRKIIYSVCILFLWIGLCGDACATGRKKKTQNKESVKQEKTTAYDKLFKGKSKVSAKGVMTVHFMDKKVYLEFPISLLGRDMLLTSMIEKTSNMAEGVPGQLSGRSLPLRFVKEDTILQVRSVRRTDVISKEGNEKFNALLENSNVPGIYKNLKIEAFTPDSSALVVEATSLFMEDSPSTNPFPVAAASGFMGLYARSQEFQSENSFVRDIKALESSVVVNMQLGYMTSRSLMGFFAPVKSPITITCDRILLLLPEEPMKIRLADSRVGTARVGYAEMEDGRSPLKNVLYTKRWRIEPSDEQAYARGELVEPRKPIVFYMDSLIPPSWQAYVKAGVEAWNLSFEKIGFKNVLRVVDFSEGAPSVAYDMTCSRIMFAPTWLSYPISTFCSDPRSGEIISVSIYLPNNLPDALFVLAASGLMGADPSVRHMSFTEEKMGGLIKVQIEQTIGYCLGLSGNSGASYAYPVDSLRSVAFTREHGLSPSVMDALMFNYVAQPEDVERGVRTTPKGIGEYDHYAIKWLYKPIAGVLSPEDERPMLDQWIEEQRNNPYCRYRNTMDRDWMYDPTALERDLGDDHIKALGYLVENTKRALAGLYEWYGGPEDKLNDYRKRLHNLTEWQLLAAIENVASYIGGVYLNDVYGDDSEPSIRAVPLEKQRAAVKCLTELMKDTDWMFSQKWQNMEGGVRQRWDFGLHWIIAGNLQKRLNFVLLSNQKTEGGYSIDEYTDVLYHLVWGPTLKGEKLSAFEMEFQYSFVNDLITTVGLMPFDQEAFLAKMMKKMREEQAIAFTRLTSCGLGAMPARVSRMMTEAFFMANPMLHDPFVMMVNESGDRNATYRAPGPIVAKRVSAPALYFDMLKKSRNVLVQAIPASAGRARQHYEYLLKKIDVAIRGEQRPE